MNMSIEDCLNESKSVAWSAGDKQGTLAMCSPTVQEAKQLRQEFYQIAHKTQSGVNADMNDMFEDFLAKVVMACLKEKEGMSIEDIQLFVLRIGGASSEVVQYAMQVCGINFDAEPNTEGDHTDF